MQIFKLIYEFAVTVVIELNGIEEKYRQKGSCNFVARYYIKKQI